MLAEAARIQAEIDKQAAEKEYNNKSQTAVLYACKMREAEDENSKKEINTARLLAEEQASQAEEEFRSQKTGDGGSKKKRRDWQTV